MISLVPRPLSETLTLLDFSERGLDTRLMHGILGKWAGRVKYPRIIGRGCMISYIGKWAGGA